MLTQATQAVFARDMRAPSWFGAEHRAAYLRSTELRHRDYAMAWDALLAKLAELPNRRRSIARQIASLGGFGCRSGSFEYRELSARLAAEGFAANWIFHHDRLWLLAQIEREASAEHAREAA